MNIQSISRNTQTGNTTLKALPSRDPQDCYISGETGGDKPLTQHVANIGFGKSCLLSLGSNVKTLLGITSKTKIARYVPFLNVGVASLETYHTVKYLSEGDKITASNAAGNAAGCASSVLEEAATASALISTARSAAFKVGASVLGLIGGVIGLVTGVVEIKKGLKTNKAGGEGDHLLKMGVLDIASGVTSTAGAILMATGVGSAIAIPCFIASSLFDLTSIAVDYLDKKSDKKKRETEEKLKNEVSLA